ncbi:MAG: GldG family protein [bacterium]
MNARTYRNRLAIEVLVVAAVLVFANLVSLKVFGRADLTSKRIYSISESTKTALGGLDDVVNIKVYFSKKLPPYLTTLTRQVRDMLDEYRAYAGGKLVVDVQDPAEDAETEERVRALGIPQVQLNVITRDKTEVMPGYLGIAVLYADKKEVLPVVQGTANLEYDLTSAILKVTRTEEKVVGFLTGHGEPDPARDYEAVTKTMAREYQITSVAIAPGQPVPPTISTLVVAGPEKVGPWDRYAIDQFVMRGGRVLFMINKIGIREGTLEAVGVDSGLDSLVAHYGAEVRSDLVVDRSCGTASFSAGYFSFSVPYPLWPLVGEAGFDETSPVTNELERAVFPWTSSIGLGVVEGVDAVVLARSSQQSWPETRSFNLDPQRTMRPAREEDKAPQNLAVLLRGSFPSYFRTRPVPAADTASAAAAGQPKIDRSPETQIIVVGNARFVETPFLGQYPENATFFLNAVDWLTLGESLIGIRSRAVISRPLKEIGESAKSTVRLVSTLGVPLAVVAFGLARRYVRSSRRKRAVAT